MQDEPGDIFRSPESFSEARERLLVRIVAALQRNQRVVGAWLSGSFGRDEADEWADLDLHVAVEDAELASFLSERLDLYQAIGEVNLLQDEIPGAGFVGDSFHLVIFDGALEVDWSFLPLSEAAKPAGHRLLFERQPIPAMEPPTLAESERKGHAKRWATFFWAMAQIAVKLAARGDTRRASTQTDLLTRALISMWRLTEQPGGPDPWVPDLNRPLEDDIDNRLPKLATNLTPALVLDHIESLCDEARLLQPALMALDAGTGERVIAGTFSLISLARRTIEAGSFRRRKYR
jgi:predicted nucleotidyltransferase